ncbi:hypothetical protein MLD38_040191 [Melastoma candidum]|uniref:Uncharacterized protein n=1 Tax=Melastoma candidum TaxID=119954 RepID=A0ACB9L637_9MYRT|nr:hypothetical protein MLD38_040191 [Melastoma candidum]
MAVGDFVPRVLQEEEEEDVVDFEDQPELIPPKDAPSHNPIAPPDESFDIPTAVDPSYVISLIRKLVPSTQPSNSGFERVDVSESNVTSISKNAENNTAVLRDVTMEEISTTGPSTKSSIIADGNDGDSIYSHEEAAEGLSCRKEESNAPDNQGDVWEKCGCMLWDLASSQNHAELMVENLVLEVLLANLMLSKSARVIEICLGTIGNLACHEGLMKSIISTEGLIGAVVEQLFSDDTQCLCEAFRLLTLGLQGSECATWVKALCPTLIIERLVWIAENTLNAMLLEKSVGLFLSILQSQQELVSVLIPLLISHGLPKLLISLLADEMSTLYGDSIPERCRILDIILQAIEALSVMEDHSHAISFSKELVELISNLVKYPNKMEIEEASMTAVVLIANVLADDPDLALDMSRDLQLFRGLLDILPFTSDDKESRNALWTVVANLLVHLKEHEMGASTLLQYVSVLVDKSDIIEDDLLDRIARPEHQSASTSANLNAVATALDRFISILKEWSVSRDNSQLSNTDDEYNADDRSVLRLLDCCKRHLKEMRG